MGISCLATVVLCAVAVLLLAVWLLRRLRRSGARPDISETSDAQSAPRPPGPATPSRSPDRPLEYHSVTAHFNATARDRLDQVAIRTVSQRATYRDLLSAAHTQSQGAGDAAGARAALVSGTLTPATAASILGLFASRTVLVAVDPALPDSRVRTLAEILAAHGYHVSSVDVPSEVPPAAAAVPTLGDEDDIDGDEIDDVTSIQFTSGSTGAPKAVLHPNGLWLCDARLLQERFGMTDGRMVALCMPVSFAAGLNVLIGSLLGGAEVIAIDPRENTARQAFDHIQTTRAQVIACTPAFVDALHTAAQGATLPGVERIVTTGEPAHARHVRLARELAPRATFTNWLGSTEVCGIASHDIEPSEPLPDGMISAGIPLAHKRVDIDDAGKVSITSRYIGLRYLDATVAAGRFVDNPDGTRTFIGGEVGRWDESDRLVLLGRADAAVKIRGYLVEPAEIESTLLRYDDVREAAVSADSTGDTPALTAYAAPSASLRTPAVAELRTRLHRDLPPWMVPAHIVVMGALPRTDRGKIDRMALPAPKRPSLDPPRGEYESTVARLWAEALRLDAVGRDDSFYALGGDSLTVAQMLAQVHDVYNIDLRQSDLASALTVAELAKKIASSRAGQPQPEDLALSATTVPLRPVSAETVGAPLFCFTGAGASSLCYVPLAESVESQTAVYAFEPKGLEKRAIPDLSVRRAAERHLTDLRRIQPHGPYVLVGHSLGCHIALEVARQLESDDEHVDLVAMLDPWLPPAVVRAARREMPDMALPMGEMVETDFKSWWAYQKTVPLAGLFFGGKQRQAAAIADVGAMTGVRYRPRPWAGRALVVMSHLNRDDPRLWPRILTGELTIRRRECDHHSIVREPHIAAVLEMINEALERRSESIDHS